MGWVSYGDDDCGGDGDGGYAVGSSFSYVSVAVQAHAKKETR
jgi:hypothetical protein